MALFLVAESKARQDAWYAGSDLLSWGRRVVITLALVAVGLNAYRIAYDLARGMWT
ncbi:MAG: hypothetical protein IPJ14_17645 [Kineosporiaceae bacterium]|nr:hypothetical protein [Kineosporiaceae bacterium]MBK7624426.1 hypothetical protein [Kineosporiaceae bacterium]MBK8077790.1 hypothetical protein [Kineosporiaceae bacterium]